MTKEEQRAYQRGYATGIRGRWPAHRPPQPPNQVIANLLLALREIRDHLDTELAVIGDPEWEAAFAPIINKADAAAESVTEWLAGAA
jgi:ribosome modulation factor